MTRRLLPFVAVLLFLTSRADAATINLLLTVDMYEPTVGPREIGFNYSLFQSASNGWPHATLQPRTFMASGAAGLLPGVTQYSIALNAASLDDIYFTGWGFYWSPDPSRPPDAPPLYPYISIYVAEPPAGHVSDALAWAVGPPWISLANVGDGMTADFYYINGYSRGDIGRWSIARADMNPVPVPEPASMLLLGSGLVAIAARRYRRSNGGRG